MTDAYYALGGTPVEDRSSLSERARALLVAVERHREFRLISVECLAIDGLVDELITVEVTCDGVPPHNDYGLQFRERLTLVVPTSTAAVPQVLALRKNFPRLAHQNRAAPDTPANLCLYFEPPRAVLRSWTPEAFLERILWWFVQNARGELHLADQPLDQLFFAGRDELVLPWDIDRYAPATEFVLLSQPPRPDGGHTLLLRPADQVDPASRTVNLISITLTPVQAGAVEISPSNLGQLSDSLEHRGAALLPAMSERFQATVGAAGVPARKEHPLTVVMVTIPLYRDVPEHIETLTRRAFLIDADPFAVGVACGALFKHEGKYFSAAGLLESTEDAAGWRSHGVTPVAVLRENDPQRARLQAGLDEPGPRITLVGAGSLGSALLHLWGRSGWGTWTVIDSDHVKPHNLSRHMALNHQLGRLKVYAVQELHEAAWRGAYPLHAIAADALDSDNKEVQTALRDAELVLDASADLDYPRLASTREQVPRHASVFITPSGQAAVLMLEDADRHIRLRTLEAQYYRAILQSEWGASHLDGHLGAFWSGASCRDLSTVLPYARVMAHAGLLAEQLPILLTSREGALRVWQRTSAHGDLLAYTLEPQHEKALPVDEHLTVYLDRGLEAELRHQREAALPNETGGILLGYHDLNVGALVLVAAIPAPGDSKSTPHSFERGLEGLKAIVEQAAHRTAGVVRYVGEWHSHPRGHSASPSSDDLYQLAHLTLQMGSEGLPAVQLIVGEHDLSVLTGAERR